MPSFANLGQYHLLLQAEVAPSGQARFETRYHAATGVAVTAGNPKHYQNQPGKWGAELRVYFNDPGMATVLDAKGVHVESQRRGYMAGTYRFRINDSKLWWKLVESYGLRLGPN
jgi:hypothetical protein